MLIENDLTVSVMVTVAAFLAEYGGVPMMTCLFSLPNTELWKSGRLSLNVPVTLG